MEVVQLDRYTLKEAKVLIERWRVHYNTIRPHRSLGQRPPAPEAWLMPIDGVEAAIAAGPASASVE